MQQSTESSILAEDRLRADLYAFLASLLTRPPDQAVIDRTGTLDGDDSELGRAITALTRVAANQTATSVEREFNRLFIGIGRGELMPFASFYLTGFLNEKPLSVLRGDMARLGVERDPDVHEPEDNIGSLCEIMSGLITGRFGDPAPLWRQREFWSRHLAPWAAHFFRDLEGARASVFYAPVGAIGRAFMEIEKESFRLAGDVSAA